MPPLTTSAINDAVYMANAKVSATNSGINFTPPLKLKPFNSGYSKETGNPVAAKLTNRVPKINAVDT